MKHLTRSELLQLRADVNAVRVMCESMHGHTDPEVIGRNLMMMRRWSENALEVLRRAEARKERTTRAKG